MASASRAHACALMRPVHTCCSKPSRSLHAGDDCAPPGKRACDSRKEGGRQVVRSCTTFSQSVVRHVAGRAPTCLDVRGASQRRDDVVRWLYRRRSATQAPALPSPRAPVHAMAPPGPCTQKFGMPLYAGAFLTDELLVLGGGGGKKSSGIANRCACVMLPRRARQLRRGSSPRRTPHAQPDGCPVGGRRARPRAGVHAQHRRRAACAVRLSARRADAALR